MLIFTHSSVFDNMEIPYPKRKFLWDDEGKDDKDKVWWACCDHVL